MGYLTFYLNLVEKSRTYGLYKNNYTMSVLILLRCLSDKRIFCILLAIILFRISNYKLPEN